MDESSEELDFIGDSLLSAFDFTTLFITFLRLKGINKFKINDLEKYILQCRWKGLHAELLDVIEVTMTNGKFQVLNLWTCINQNIEQKLVYINPNDNGGYVYLNTFEVGELLFKYEEFFDSMLAFVEGFKNNSVINESNLNNNEIKKKSKK